MKLQIPNFKEPGLTKFLTDLLLAITKMESTFLKARTANHSVLLQSSDNSTFEVTVSNAGALVVTKVQG